MSGRLHFVPAALSALLLSLALPARADGEPGRLRLGLRSGFALPYGRFADIRTLATFRDTNVHSLSDDIHGAIPIWLDAGYQLTPRLMLGGYAVLGLVLPKVAPAMNPLSGGCPETAPVSVGAWASRRSTASSAGRCNPGSRSAWATSGCTATSRASS